MNFKCGIIGLPNVGKSALFNLITKSNVNSANFPFCTINPNIKLLPIIDNRLYKLYNLYKSNSILFPNIEIIDIAGLIKGSHLGKGLGNKFLKDIKSVDLILHVVRSFKDDNIFHIENNINPTRDIDIINFELIMSDIEYCKLNLSLIKEKSKYKTEYNKNIINVLDKCYRHLYNIKMLNSLFLNSEEKKLLNNIEFLTIKPIIYIFNTNFSNENEFISLNEKENFKKKSILSICAKYNLAKENLNKYNEFIKLLIHTIYNSLNIKTFYTCNKKQSRATLIRYNTNILQAANKIHSDFKKGFIRAEIISFKDILKYKNEQELKKSGKIRYEGKNYIIRDGDIIKFLFAKK